MIFSFLAANWHISYSCPEDIHTFSFAMIQKSWSVDSSKYTDKQAEWLCIK